MGVGGSGVGGLEAVSGEYGRGVWAGEGDASAVYDGPMRGCEGGCCPLHGVCVGAGGWTGGWTGMGGVGAGKV